ncbi:MAG: GNAT family N-acetyltransferase [Oscillospiraceae bacterium]|nr:GNAT family N-acetyltransferase [Oscillospiraceae bacterium]
MTIEDFTVNHIEQAARMAKRSYDAERERVPALPPVTDWPDMTGLAQNNLGAAAFEGGEMLGFLCCLNPWDGAFGVPGLRGVFSPMHANGTVPENRAAIYARLYRAAGEKWARAGAASHGICLYAHDTEGQAQFFRYGFGMRCVDAIRPMEDIPAPPREGYTFAELAPEEFGELWPLENRLRRHFLESPCFMLKAPETEESFLQAAARARWFAARRDGVTAAFLRAEITGETFLCDTPGYIHCDGAYCRPEYRGTGVFASLLAFAVQTLKAGGFTRLGTDFESINPAAHGFWRKHFSAYTHGVVRRIDEGAVELRKKERTV